MRTTPTMVLLALAAGLAACSDNTMAPRGATSPDAQSGATVQGSTKVLGSVDVDTFTFTIYPWQKTTVWLGQGNTLTIPSHSLCDPSSSYGLGQWDQPCSLASSPLTVSVIAFLDASGHAHVDFNQHVRFAPSTSPSQWVQLAFGDYSASVNPFANILYCPTTSSSGCVNEAKTDASLQTVHDPVSGKVTRRIKHFSGYNVAAGDDGSGNPTAMSSLSNWRTGLWLATNSQSVYALPGANAADKFLEQLLASRHSGYILASG